MKKKVGNGVYRDEVRGETQLDFELFFVGILHSALPAFSQ